MANPKSMYRRLSGRHRTLSGYSQVWLAPDHLLLVKSTRFIEYYQRFALADIQAIVVTRLGDRTSTQIGFGIAAILWSLLALTVDSIFARGIFLGTGVIALAVIVADMARGPRCRCYLHTAVSRELLQSLGRVRTAGKFLRVITPAIEEVQGRLPLFETSEEASSAPMVEKPPEVPVQVGYLPEALFVLLLVDAALVLAIRLFPRQPIVGILPTTLFAEVALMVAALLRRSGRDSRRVLYGMMLVAMLCLGDDVLHLARNFYSLFDTGQRHATVSIMSTWEPLKGGETTFAALWRFAVGTIGLMSAYLERSS